MAKDKANDAFVLENVELYFTKVDPDNTVEISQDGKTGWETQLRTKDKKVAQHWRDMAIQVKAVREDKEDDESPIQYWRATLRRKEFNAKNMREIMALKDSEGISLDAATRLAVKNGDAVQSKAPTVIGGDLSEIDPRSIGNGSIANVRVFQYDYSFKSESGALQEGVSSVLMGIQVTELHEYVPQALDGGFEKTEMKVVSVAEQQGEEAPVTKKKASKKAKAADLDDDEIPF